MKILFCHRVSPELRAVYQNSLPENLELIFPDDLSEKSLEGYSRDIDIAVGYKFSREFLMKAKKLIHIQIPWTGAESLDFDLLKEFPHVSVSNSHSNSLAIAEHACR